MEFEIDWLATVQQLHREEHHVVVDKHTEDLWCRMQPEVYRVLQHYYQGLRCRMQAEVERVLQHYNQGL